MITPTRSQPCLLCADLTSSGNLPPLNQQSHTVNEIELATFLKGQYTGEFLLINLAPTQCRYNTKHFENQVRAKHPLPSSLLLLLCTTDAVNWNMP